MRVSLYKYHEVTVELFYERQYAGIKDRQPELPDESVRGIVANMTIGFILGLNFANMFDWHTTTELIKFATKKMTKKRIDWKAVISLMGGSKEAPDATDQHPDEPHD
jgi:hypothetical protein